VAGFWERLKEKIRPNRVLGYYEKFDYHWTMVIDLDKCDGCGACTVACSAENNLPIVGKQECDNAREFSWLRIERYVEGEYPNFKAKFIPVMCQHCDKAPCETGCPVYATYHNQDGLNVQVYNRCIGTYTCASYCPYDARRFNWFEYTKTSWPAPLEQQLNPEVSVRGMGVMEKCTFCIQRIRTAKDTAKDDNRRRVADGEVSPACGSSCPTGAITFGDLNDPNSEVSKLAKSPRRYRLLEDRNAAPSVIYLKRVEDHGKLMRPAKGIHIDGSHGMGSHAGEQHSQLKNFLNSSDHGNDLLSNFLNSNNSKGKKEAVHG